MILKKLEIMRMKMNKKVMLVFSDIEGINGYVK